MTLLCTVTATATAGVTALALSDCCGNDWWAQPQLPAGTDDGLCVRSRAKAGTVAVKEGPIVHCAAAALSRLYVSAHNDITELQDISRLGQRHDVCLLGKDAEHHTLWVALIYQPNVLKQVCSSGVVAVGVLVMCCRLWDTAVKKEALCMSTCLSAWHTKDPPKAGKYCSCVAASMVCSTS
jgi:hypothetical protein